MKHKITLLILSVLVCERAAVCEHFATEAFLIVRRVVDRIEQDQTQTHDILCINCGEQVFEDVSTKLHNERPYVPMRRITLTPGSIDVSPTEIHRKPSLVLQICTSSTYCQWGLPPWYANPNKYSTYIQLLHGVSSLQMIQYANELTSGGVLKVLQFVAPSQKYTNASVFITGALTHKMIKIANDSEAEKRLFDDTLTNFSNFVYEVGFVPMIAHAHVTKNKFFNLEISSFLTILKKQGAKYRFHRDSQLSDLIRKMMIGKMNVILNAVETTANVFEIAYWKDIQEFCIVLPRRYERMHLQLLLTPFKWQIWLMIVVILVAIQIASIIFPERVPRYLILKCFFGGGVSEHKLATGNRLVVCVICVLIFLFTETYQAILLSLMSADPFVKNPETVDEFIENNESLIILRGTKYKLPVKLTYLVKEVTEMHSNTTLQNASIVSCDLAHYLNTNPFKLHLPVKADLIVIKPRVFFQMRHIVFSSTCPVVREYQRYMDILYDVGLYHKEKQILYPKKMYTRREQTFNDLIVFTEDLIPVWELLGTGLLLAFSCFIAEVLIFKLRFMIKKFNT